MKKLLIVLTLGLLVGTCLGQGIVDEIAFQVSAGTVATPTVVASVGSLGGSSPNYTISESVTTATLTWSDGTSGSTINSCVGASACTPGAGTTNPQTMSATDYYCASAQKTGLATSPIVCVSATVSAPVQDIYGVQTVGGSDRNFNWTLCTPITTGSHAAGYSSPVISTYTNAQTGSQHLEGAIMTGTTSPTVVCVSNSVVIPATGAAWLNTTPSGCGTLTASTSYLVCTQSDSTSSTYLYYNGVNNVWMTSSYTYGTWTGLTLSSNGNSFSQYVTVNEN